MLVVLGIVPPQKSEGPFADIAMTLGISFPQIINEGKSILTSGGFDLISKILGRPGLDPARNWVDVQSHKARGLAAKALGNFEFIDEWWKANTDLPEYVQKERPEWYAKRSAIYKNLQPENQDIVPQFGLPFLDGWSYEEWLGVVSVGNGKNSAFVRQLRPAYFTLKDMWNK